MGWRVIRKVVPEYKEQAQWPEYIIGSPLFENSYLGHECVDVISM